MFEYISTHCAETIAVERGARLAHLSESRFSRVFKQISGMTFVNYVTHVRLSRALRMLRESPATIAEVALAAGFSDQSLETPGIAVLDSFVLVTTMEGCAGSQIGMRQAGSVECDEILQRDLSSGSFSRDFLPG